ncbi:MAG TPA: 4-alpha-glucanotransferase, partial [Candidatus Paceibacterota bacterium]|nr:4-alpha-glucanotransferase [Candidatus Paceibacterota bacterium]
KANLANVLRACLIWLARAPAEIVLVNLEDLLLEKLPQNTPGTYKERPNWRRKAKLPLEQLLVRADIRESLRELQKVRGR